MYKGNYDYSGGRAFDASGPSGLAFLTSQLELIEPDITRPLQSTTHGRDIPIEIGGGFPDFISAWATNYATTGSNEWGLQGTNNTDIPLIQVDVQKGTWNTFIWQSSMVVTYLDLKKMEFANRSGQAPPISLQEMMEDGIANVWTKALDRVTYLGWLGQAGLVNNPVVPSVTAAADTNSHTAWSYKIQDTNGTSLILADFNAALNATVQNSGYNIKEGMADTVLLPYTQHALLSTPMTIAGCSSALEYLEKNSVAAMNGINLTINALPNPWISQQGTGSTDRAVFYKKNKQNVMLKIPQPMERGISVPTTRSGGAYETIFNGCVSQVIWRRPTTALYLDGI